MYRHNFEFFEIGKDALDEIELNEPNFKISTLHNGIYLISKSKHNELTASYKDDINFISICEFAFAHLQSEVNFGENKLRWVLYIDIESILNKFNYINGIATCLIYIILYAEILASIDFDSFNLNRNKLVKEFIIHQKVESILQDALREIGNRILEHDELEQYYPRFLGRNSLGTEVSKFINYLSKFSNINHPLFIAENNHFKNSTKTRDFIDSKEQFTDDFIDSLAEQLKDIDELNSIESSIRGGENESIS